MSDELREQVFAVLRSKKPRAEQVDELLALIRPAPEDVVEVWTRGTRHELREVEAYGLVIGLDAADRATRVYFPDGAFEWSEPDE